MLEKPLKLIILMLVSLFVHSAYASIDPSAPSASHQLEEASAEIHEYLHDNYTFSYGTHDLEEASAELHHFLHEWQHGEATESDVVAAFTKVKNAYTNSQFQLRNGGILNNGDEELELLFEHVKVTYKHVRFLLRKAK